MKTIPCIPLVAVWTLFFSGCYSTKNIGSFGELSDALHDPIRILAADTTIYDLRRFSFNDSLLEGKGEHLVRGNWIPFSGALPISQIVYIQSRRFNLFGSIVGVASAGLVVAGFEQSTPGRGLSVFTTMGGGGSCPYVYAWNGSGYVRQGEVFGTALGKALETSTGCMLPDASALDGVIRLRIADERPETHYINSIRVCAYEVPRGAQVVLDTRNRAWPLASLLPPLRAPLEIMHRDNLRWKLNTVRRGNIYRDSLEITLPRTGALNEGSLVVHALNTHLPDAVIGKLFGYLGDESLPYLYRMEHDPRTIGLLKGWMEECALRVEVWDGVSWNCAGVIPPEANEVPFTRLLRIPAPASGGDSLRIRLTALADTWEIDAVEVDWSPAAPLEEHVLQPLAAEHSRLGPVGQALRSNDADYVMLLPGEGVNMNFRALYPRDGYSIVYACHASGYLYEWFPEKQVTVDFPVPFGLPGVDRMDVVEYLLGNREAMLELFFNRWDAENRM